MATPYRSGDIPTPIDPIMIPMLSAEAGAKTTALRRRSQTD
jgi:hypothetical protein